MNTKAASRIRPADDAAIADAARALRNGELVAFPTETVYGLAADAGDARAVAAVYAAKGRPAFNPLIAHVADLATARRIARFDEPGKPFEIATVSLPTVNPGEILIRVTRANICGSDVHAWHGTFATRGLGGQLPTVLGHEMVGAIEALGDGVDADSNGKPLTTGTRVVFPYFFS